MDNFGFIREKMDIKLLILFILDRLPRPIDRGMLTDLVMCDDAINYFVFAQALGEMVETEHVIELDNQYFISDKGRRMSRDMESTLPFTIRMKCQQSTERASQVLRRSAMIQARHTNNEDGSCFVALSLSDGKGAMLKLELLAGSEKSALDMEKKFKANAEDLYLRIANMLLE